MKSSPGVWVSAGEPSGDRAAARAVQRLSAAGVRRFCGIGGAALKAEGVELFADIERFSAMGVADSASRLRDWFSLWADIREKIRAFSPDAALLTDAPELNLPTARVLKAAGVPVVYYVGPQVWAWRKHRLGLLRDRTDKVALILPFEKPLYDKAGVPATFVGHPILDEPPPVNRKTLRRALGIPLDAPAVALLPGSRPAELARHLPVMTKAALLLRQKNIIAVLAPGGPHNPACRIGAETKPPMFLPAEFTARDLSAASDAALIVSGTASLEAAVCGVPSAVVYRTDPLTYALGRHVLSLPYIALPNWIAEKKIMPEILQRDVTAENLCQEARRLLRPDVSADLRAAFKKVKSCLGGPGAADKTAALVLDQLISRGAVHSGQGRPTQI
jgi:lipid-A-disaccharide synthase